MMRFLFFSCKFAFYFIGGPHKPHDSIKKMKILVCISQVPETTAKISFDAAGKQLNKSGVKFVVNPYDEFSLSKALEFQEKDPTVKITLLSVGTAEVLPVINAALAVGGDDAVRIDIEPTDGYTVAFQISEYAKAHNYDLIMMGKESIDNNASEVPGMVAEMLGYPYVSFATKLEIAGNTATINREIDGGVEELECDLPLLISAQKGLAEWRIASMRGIMAAKKKPVTIVSPSAANAKTQISSYILPDAKAGCKMIAADDLQQLVEVLSSKGVL